MHPVGILSVFHAQVRRLRATFLLRCVILAWCILLFAAVLGLGMGTQWTLGSLMFCAVLWLVGIECGLLPLVLERTMVRHAARGDARGFSIWFVDLDQTKEQQLQDFHDDSRDNPTIRSSTERAPPQRQDAAPHRRMLESPAAQPTRC